MPSILHRNRFVAPTMLVVGIIVGILSAPLWKQAIIWIAYDDYAALVFKCDNAMREHYRAKILAGERASYQTVQNLEAAELALIDCQDYDILRKRLIQFGLSENELSLMGLQAIEERGTTLQRVIRIHEIRY